MLAAHGLPARPVGTVTELRNCMGIVSTLGESANAEVAPILSSVVLKQVKVNAISRASDQNGRLGGTSRPRAAGQAIGGSMAAIRVERSLRASAYR